MLLSMTFASLLLLFSSSNALFIPSVKSTATVREPLATISTLHRAQHSALSHCDRAPSRICPSLCVMQVSFVRRTSWPPGDGASRLHHVPRIGDAQYRHGRKMSVTRLTHMCVIVSHFTALRHLVCQWDRHFSSSSS